MPVVCVASVIEELSLAEALSIVGSALTLGLYQTPGIHDTMLTFYHFVGFRSELFRPFAQSSLFNLILDMGFPK